MKSFLSKIEKMYRNLSDHNSIGISEYISGRYFVSKYMWAPVPDIIVGKILNECEIPNFLHISPLIFLKRRGCYK